MPRRLLALLAVAAAAGVGTALAGDAPPARATAGQLAAPRVERAAPACPLPTQYRPAFEAAARDTELPLALLVAVGEVESNLRHEARSHAGARGLLQVMPTTAAGLRLEGPDARSNVLAGARYLRLLLRRFDAPDLALAAYNAGPTAVAAYGGAPTQETLTYVANVLLRWRELRGCR